MQKYTIEVKETLQRLLEVEAENLNEAIEIVSKKYDDGEIILDFNDYVGCDIVPFEG